MQELRLRKQMFNSVLDGSKTSTSRKGRRNIKLGLLTLIMTEDESIKTVVKVINVSYKRFNDISDEDAIKEGYSNKEELKEVLLKIYPNIQNKEIITIIDFGQLKRNRTAVL